MVDLDPSAKDLHLNTLQRIRQIKRARGVIKRTGHQPSAEGTGRPFQANDSEKSQTRTFLHLTGS